jgi:hypothetical protein
MRGMLAPLTTHEEAALRKIGFGGDDPLEPSHVRRLLHLELIAWNGGRWRVTELGRRRFDSLANPASIGDEACVGVSDATQAE